MERRLAVSQETAASLALLPLPAVPHTHTVALPSPSPSLYLPLALHLLADLSTGARIDSTRLKSLRGLQPLLRSPSSSAMFARDAPLPPYGTDSTSGGGASYFTYGAPRTLPQAAGAFNGGLLQPRTSSGAYGAAYAARSPHQQGLNPVRLTRRERAWGEESVCEGGSVRSLSRFSLALMSSPPACLASPPLPAVRFHGVAIRLASATRPACCRPSLAPRRQPQPEREPMPAPMSTPPLRRKP